MAGRRSQKDCWPDRPCATCRFALCLAVVCCRRLIEFRVPCSQDLIKSVMSSTGFPPSALYHPSQLVWANIAVSNRDRRCAVVQLCDIFLLQGNTTEKCQFLRRFVVCISVALGEKVGCSVWKVLQGLEPEQTNAMLQQFGRAAGLMKEGKLAMDGAALVAAVEKKLGEPRPATATPATSTSAAPPVFPHDPSLPEKVKPRVCRLCFLDFLFC